MLVAVGSKGERPTNILILGPVWGLWVLIAWESGGIYGGGFSGDGADRVDLDGFEVMLVLRILFSITLGSQSR